MKKKIKIAYLCQSEIIGGSERFLSRLISNLNRRRFKACVIFPKNGPVLELFRTKNIQTVIINTQRPFYLKHLGNFLSQNLFDLTQSSHYNPILAMASNINRIPHIWRVASRIHLASLSGNSSLSEKKNMLNLINCLSDQIICNSKFMQQQFLESGIKKSKVIYNGIDFGELNKYRSDRSALHLNIKHPCKIGFIGYFLPQKRVTDFVEAASIVLKSVPNAHFSIFGTTYNSSFSLKYFKDLKYLIKKKSLEKKVIIYGFQNNIIDRISKLDIVVLPSIDEGGSNAILEAMALGKPVIAADSGSNPEFVKDGQTGLLFPPKDFVRLAEKILLLIKNQELAARMGVAAKDRTERLFDIKDCLRQYEDLYRKTVEKYYLKK